MTKSRPFGGGFLLSANKKQGFYASPRGYDDLTQGPRGNPVETEADKE